MGFPRWLWKLSDKYNGMFDHVCPGCHNYVDKDETVCPKCRHIIQMPVKVPPKIYKNPLALKKFVHNSLLDEHRNELEPWQINYLNHYFSPAIFEDDFESTDFSAWTATGGAPTVVNTYAFCGTWSALFDATGENAYKGIAGTGEVFWRVYVYFETINLPSNGNIHMFMRETNGTTTEAQLKLVNDGGTVKWGFDCRLFDNSFEGIFSATPIPTEDTWYCCEIRFDRNTLNGGQFWIDSVLKGTIVGTTKDVNINRVYVQQVSNNQVVDIYIDCCEADSIQVGCIAVGQQLFTLINEMQY